MNGLDTTILLWINHWPNWLYGVFIIFSHGFKWLWFKTILLSIAAFLLIKNSTRKAATIAFISFIMANTFTHYFKKWIAFKRPCVVIPDELIQRVDFLRESYGTTSAHAANMMAIAVVFTYYWKGKGVPWIFIALMTGLSRIYFGLHYPSQIFLGFGVGILSAYLSIKIVEKFFFLRTHPSKVIDEKKC